MTTPADVPDQASRHDPVYDQLSAAPEFAELRKRYRGFVLPATAAFLVWYLLYILMSNYAAGFMDTKVVGNINVALVFGLLQFVSTFGIAWLYARHAGDKLDPIAEELEGRYNAEVGKAVQR